MGISGDPIAIGVGVQPTINKTIEMIAGNWILNVIECFTIQGILILSYPSHSWQGSLDDPSSIHAQFALDLYPVFRYNLPLWSRGSNPCQYCYV